MFFEHFHQNCKVIYFRCFFKEPTYIVSHISCLGSYIPHNRYHISIKLGYGNLVIWIFLHLLQIPMIVIVARSKIKINKHKQTLDCLRRHH